MADIPICLHSLYQTIINVLFRERFNKFNLNWIDLGCQQENFFQLIIHFTNQTVWKPWACWHFVKDSCCIHPWVVVETLLIIFYFILFIYLFFSKIYLTTSHENLDKDSLRFGSLNFPKINRKPIDKHEINFWRTKFRTIIILKLWMLSFKGFNIQWFNHHLNFLHGISLCLHYHKKLSIQNFNQFRFCISTVICVQLCVLQICSIDFYVEISLDPITNHMWCDLKKPVTWCKIDIFSCWYHVKVWIILFPELFYLDLLCYWFQKLLMFKGYKNKEKQLELW